MGVWIETEEIECFYEIILSHPVWVCGLKHIAALNRDALGLVTPCMGVWIETCDPCRLVRSCQSHPVWVCGLKQILPQPKKLKSRSHPVWVCGLKPPRLPPADGSGQSHPVWVCGLKLGRCYRISNRKSVTPCMGVWIETLVAHQGFGP